MLYPFSEDELKAHLQDAGGWNGVQAFFGNIQDLVRRDGWTNNEIVGDALVLFSELRKVGPRDVKGKKREWFEKQTHWAEKSISRVQTTRASIE